MKTITKNQYLQLVGLMTLGRKHNEMCREIEKAACEITGEDVAGHTVDMMYGDRELDEGLKLLGVQVAESADNGGC